MHLYYDIYIYMSYTKYNFEFRRHRIHNNCVMTLEIREKEICRSTNFSKKGIHFIGSREIQFGLLFRNNPRIHRVSWKVRMSRFRGDRIETRVI